MTIETILLFFVTSILLGLTPGPDNIFVLTQSALHGRKAGIFVTFGLCTGLIFHTSAVALGIAAVFQASPIAFDVLKIVGAAYLIYLAYMSFKANASNVDAEQQPALSWKQLYLRGVIMNITNPKVVIFFLAFLPQFVDPAQGAVSWQIMILGLLFILSTILVFCSIAWFSGLLGDKLKQSNRAQILLNKIAGTVFAGLALRLALAER